MADVIAGKYTTQASVGVAGRIDAYTATNPEGAKVLLMTAAVSSQHDEERFASRAQQAAGVAHQDVAKIIDWGVDGELFYAAQEWVEGRDLSRILKDRGTALDGVNVARMGAQAAAALSAAHARGVVHGDVRPEDLILMAGDDIKVAGLGAPLTADPVKLAEDSPPAAAHYISPEQARGEAPTKQSDIYSLGAVLYQLATGAVPFDAASGLLVAEAHARRPVEPARQVNPNVPASLEKVISKAMAKDPMQRYGSAEEMRADLERIADGAAVQAGATTVMPAVQPTGKKRSPWGWIVSVILVLLLAFGAWWFFLRGDIEVPDLSGLTIEEAEQALTDAGLVLGEVEYSEDFPEGTVDRTVFEQDPEAGAMARDEAEVDIVLAGSELAEVPDLDGLLESQAVLAIRDAGFELGDVTREFDPDAEVGAVISQTPSAGTEAPAGAPIAITVSKGEELLSVPGVIGQTEDQATTMIEDAGLRVRVVEEYSDTVAAGTVVSQSPDPGVTVQADTQVTISVSQGPPPAAQVRVPNVVGDAEATAIARLEGAGLVAEVSYVTDDLNAGNVTAQMPTSGSMVDEGSTVQITVAE